MKSILTFILVLLPLSSFGVCYQATKDVPAGIPKTLCLESIQDTIIYNRLKVASADNSFPTSLNVDESTRHNESVMRFTASAILVDVWETNCGDRIFASLQVKGTLAHREIDPAALEIQVSTEITPDSCHSRAQQDVIDYKLLP